MQAIETSPSYWFDQLSDDQLVSVTRHHAEKFNRAWRVVMSTHYKTGQHIDATDTMDRHYAVLGQLVDYAYGNRPHTVWGAVVTAANWQS